MDALVVRFQADRPHLRALAYRLLGSLDDAVQAAWLKASQADLRDVANLTGWLTTVTARECLTVLRGRRRRGEVPLSAELDVVAAGSGVEDEVLQADAVGRVLLVVLDRLTPPERVALVLHDMFAVPFDEIAAIVDRSPVAAKKLASRARHKVRAAPAYPPARLAEQRRVVQAFLAAARAGNVDRLLALLAPDVVRRADAAAVPDGVAREVRGARAVVEETVALRARAGLAELALVDGGVGLVVAPRGRLMLALTFIVADGRIGGYEVIADPARLATLPMAVLEYSTRTGRCDRRL